MLGVLPPDSAEAYDADCRVVEVAHRGALPDPSGLVGKGDLQSPQEGDGKGEGVLGYLDRVNAAGVGDDNVALLELARDLAPVHARAGGLDPFQLSGCRDHLVGVASEQDIGI